MIINSLLAYRVGVLKEKKDNKMIIPTFLMKFIPGDFKYNNDSGKYDLKSTMLPYAKNEILTEGVYWLRKIIEENVYD